MEGLVHENTFQYTDYKRKRYTKNVIVNEETHITLTEFKDNSSAVSSPP